MAAKEFPLSVVIRAVDRVTGPLRNATAAVSRFGARIRATGRGISERLGLPVLGAAAGRLGTALGTLGRQVGMIGGAVAAMGAAAAAAGFQMVRAFADTGGELKDLSDQTGISAERLQELRYAAKQTGVETGELDQALRVLSKNIGLAFTSQKGPVFDVLEGLGVRLKGANGQLRATEDLLPEIAERLSRIKEPALQAAAAQALLGRAGIKLLPMLKGGRKGLEDFAARARELGIVISNDTVAAADDFGDRLDDLGSAMMGVRNVIGTALLPQFQKLVEQVTDFTIRNRAQIQAFFEDFAAKLPGRVEQAIKAFSDLRTAVQPVLDAFAWLADRFGGANVALALVGGALTVTLVPAIYATTTALYAMGAALLATPVGWIIAAIVGIVAGLNYLYNRFEVVRTVLDAISAGAIYFFKTFTPLGGLISQWDEMKAAFATAYDALRPLGRAIAWVFMNMTPLGLAIQNWDQLKVGLGYLATVASAVGRAIGWVFMNMTPIGLAIQNWDTLKGGLGVVWDALKVLGEGFLWFFMNLTPMGQLIKNWDTVKLAIDAVGAAFSGLWEQMKNGFAMASGWVADFAAKVAGMVPDWMRNMFAGEGGQLNMTAAGPATGAALGAQDVGRNGANGQNGDVRVRVDLGNLPPGSKVKSESSGRPNFELNQGYAMGIPQ